MSLAHSGLERPIEADAEQAINDERGGPGAQRERGVQLRPIGRRFPPVVQHLDSGGRERCSRAARASSPLWPLPARTRISFPGRVNRAGGAAGDTLADAANDFRFGLARGPRGLFQARIWAIVMTGTGMIFTIYD